MPMMEDKEGERLFSKEGDLLLEKLSSLIGKLDSLADDISRNYAGTEYRGSDENLILSKYLIHANTIIGERAGGAKKKDDVMKLSVENKKIIKIIKEIKKEEIKIKNEIIPKLEEILKEHGISKEKETTSKIKALQELGEKIEKLAIGSELIGIGATEDFKVMGEALYNWPIKKDSAKGELLNTLIKVFIDNADNFKDLKENDLRNAVWEKFEKESPGFLNILAKQESPGGKIREKISSSAVGKAVGKFFGDKAKDKVTTEANSIKLLKKIFTKDFVKAKLEGREVKSDTDDSLSRSFSKSK